MDTKSVGFEQLGTLLMAEATSVMLVWLKTEPAFTHRCTLLLLGRRLETHRCCKEPASDPRHRASDRSLLLAGDASHTNSSASTTLDCCKEPTLNLTTGTRSTETIRPWPPCDTYRPHCSSSVFASGPLSHLPASHSAAIRGRRALLTLATHGRSLPHHTVGCRSSTAT
jgi:hypothetical protein